MTIQLIRNATLKINYGGKTILVDPMFSTKGAFESFAGIEKNPTVDLPIDVNEIIKDIDLVLVTHTHEDHFDKTAQKILSKNIPLFCQPADELKIKNKSFINVTVINDQLKWNEILISRTIGKHGSGEILNQMGQSSGFVLQSETEPTIYIIGDSIWTKEVKESLHKYKPQFVITNSGGAFIPGFEETPIIMNEKETINVAKELPYSTIICVHLESLDHCTVTRNSLRKIALKENINGNRLFIPNDGELLKFD
jgi:L-ascorbate metabolism protein UlaG (beta-lactamase superfamily)